MSDYEKRNIYLFRFDANAKKIFTGIVCVPM